MQTLSTDSSPGMWLDWTWQRQINLIWVAAVGQRAKQLWDLVLSPPWSWERSPTEPLLSLKTGHILGPAPRPIINRLRFLVHLRPSGPQRSGHSFLWWALTLRASIPRCLGSLRFPNLSGYWLKKWFYEMSSKTALLGNSCRNENCSDVPVFL